jgi:hypothetical protein
LVAFFGATMNGFFIVPASFFGGMVVAYDGGGRGWEGGEEAGEEEGGKAAMCTGTILGPEV